ncbi:MAG: hypothetical protein IJ728_05285 [Selenomonadaceae bacterium]|nr:hypothetical protein [Selenomonadaceae bacterium]
MPRVLIFCFFQGFQNQIYYNYFLFICTRILQVFGNTTSVAVTSEAPLNLKIGNFTLPFIAMQNLKYEKFDYVIVLSGHFFNGQSLNGKIPQLLSNLMNGGGGALK